MTTNATQQATDPYKAEVEYYISACRMAQNQAMINGTARTEAIAERDAALRECERLTTRLKLTSDTMNEYMLQRDAAQAECERLRADAERYLWIKSQDQGQAFYFHGIGHKYVENLDAAIDAAIDAARAKP